MKWLGWAMQQVLKLGRGLVFTACATLLACQSLDQSVKHENMIHPELSQARDESKKLQEQQQLNSDISRSLLPPLQDVINEEQERFDVSANQVPAREFFLGLVSGTDKNMVVHPSIEGDISIQLKWVTIDEVLKAVRDSYGYEYRITSYGYHILPNRMSTRIYHLDYLNVTRDGASLITVSSGQLTSNDTTSSSSEEGESNTNPSVSAKYSASVSSSSISNLWAELQETISTIIGNEEGRRVIINPQGNLVVVRARPEEHRDVEAFLRDIRGNIKRQVIIEAKVLEVSLSDGFQQGIRWDNLARSASGSGDSISTLDPNRSLQLDLGAENLINADDINGIFSFRAAFSDFSLFIELLQTQGEVQVLSSPRISTVNNQKAVIKVGSDEYFITDVETNITSSVNGDNVSPDFTFLPFFSGVALDVTPQISEDDNVILHVHPSVSEVEERTKRVTFNDQIFEIPLAFSTIRETDSIIRARSGQIVVIGGLLKKQLEDTQARVPVLSDIPVMGSLFTQKRQTVVRSELVILLRPKIVDDDGWIEEIDQSYQRTQGFN